MGCIGPVAALSADQAEAIMLRVVVGLDVARVAAITGKRPGAVRVFTHRGLRQLAERLGADFPVRGKVASARDAYPTIASKTRISSDLTVVFQLAYFYHTV